MRSEIMKTAIIAIIMFLSVGFCNVQASSPPWGGDEHYTFSDDDPYFVESSIGEFASVDIIGGSFGSLHCFNYSEVYMNAGTGAWIQAYDQSKLYLSGGTLGSLRADEFSEVTFYVDNYSIEPTGGTGWTGTLTGTWLNNSGQFEIKLWEDTVSHTNFVPEPSTVVMLALGGLFLRKGRN
jgi:hypothetical protein